MASPLVDKLNLEDVLCQFNVYGRYHAVSGAFLVLGMAFSGIWYMNYIFAIERVGYRCADNLKEFDLNSSISNVQHYTSAAWCHDPNSCSEWLYDNNDSFMAEFKLHCQDWKMTLIGGAHSFGHMFGVLIVGSLSDRFGRKALFISTAVASATLGIAKSFGTVYWLYIALEIIEGAVSDSISPIFTLAIEMVAKTSRVTYTTICNFGFGGGIVFALIAWLVPYWRTLLRIIYAPGLLAIFLIFILDESPRWLLSKGRKTEAVEILRKAAKRNEIKIEEDLDMIFYEKDERPSFAKVLKDTFKSRLLLKRLFVCCIWWVACTFAAHGMMIHSVSLSGNKYLNFALMSGMKVPSSFLAAIIITKFNRKRPVIFLLLAYVLICTVLPFIPKDPAWPLVLTFMVGKLVTSMCLNVTYILTSELFPTHTRNSMLALCSSTGRVGSILASQTPLLMAYWAGLPTAMFGAVTLAAALVTMLVPDPGDRSLPDTVRQAEALEDAESKNNPETDT